MAAYSKSFSRIAFRTASITLGKSFIGLCSLVSIMILFIPLFNIKSKQIVVIIKTRHNNGLIWYSAQESNLQPLVPETNALSS